MGGGDPTFEPDAAGNETAAVEPDDGSRSRLLRAVPLGSNTLEIDILDDQGGASDATQRYSHPTASRRHEGDVACAGLGGGAEHGGEELLAPGPPGRVGPRRARDGPAHQAMHDRDDEHARLVERTTHK